MTIPHIQHNQGCELSNLRRHHCQLVVAIIEVPQLVLLEDLIEISAIQMKVFNPQLSHARDIDTTHRNTQKKVHHNQVCTPASTHALNGKCFFVD